MADLGCITSCLGSAWFMDALSTTSYDDEGSSIHIFRSNSELFQDPWEVLFDDISLNRIIGEGAFGKVYSGRLLKQTIEVEKGRKSLQRKTNKEQMKMSLTVAVKMLQSMI